MPVVDQLPACPSSPRIPRGFDPGGISFNSRELPCSSPLHMVFMTRVEHATQLTSLVAPRNPTHSSSAPHTRRFVA